MRGLSRVAEQCLLTAAVQNMKKIAMCCGSTHSFLFRFFSLFTKKKAYLLLEIDFVSGLKQEQALLFVWSE